MADIDIKQIIIDCTNEVKTILGKSWKKYKPYAEHEFNKFAESAEFLAKLKVSGNIDEQELKLRLEIQELAFKNVLLAIQGIGIVTVQNVLNAVLGVVYKAINAVLGGVIPL